jgi:3-methyladenine DNA glycosylase AlkD
LITTLKSNLLELSKRQPPPKISFFKTKPGDYAENDLFLNIPVPQLRTFVPRYKDIILSDLSVLIKSSYNEERLLSLFLLIDKIEKKMISLEDGFYFYLNHLDYINNWNLVDSSAHIIIGQYLIDKDKALLFSLSENQDLWKRRIAIVSTWYFIRKKNLLTTFEIAEKLLKDKEDLIHKAVGWMLREAGKKDELLLREFIDKFGLIMPRRMFRYAIEKLFDRKEIMKKFSYAQ